MTGQMGRFLHQTWEKKRRLKAADDAGLTPVFQPSLLGGFDLLKQSHRFSD